LGVLRGSLEHSNRLVDSSGDVTDTPADTQEGKQAGHKLLGLGWGEGEEGGAVGGLEVETWASTGLRFGLSVGGVGGAEAGRKLANAWAWVNRDEGDVMVFWRWVSKLVLLALEGGRLCGGCGMQS
jgi:hypothetical protein